MYLLCERWKKDCRFNYVQLLHGEILCTHITGKQLKKYSELACMIHMVALKEFKSLLNAARVLLTIFTHSIRLWNFWTTIMSKFPRELRGI